MSKENKQIDNGNIVLYKNRIEVEFKDKTVWLTQKNIADLFNIERSVVTKHIRNIFKTNELARKSVCAKFAHTAEDDKVYQTQFYNLDMIISVGYRVNSKKGTQFRIWATNVLRKHLIDGYTIDQKRLQKVQDKYVELKKAVKLMSNAIDYKDVSKDAKGFLQVITEYTRALDILDDYDHDRLSAPKGIKKVKYKMNYKKAVLVIEQMKEKFKDSDLVGKEKDNSFKGSIETIYQTFSGKDLYPTTQEKAAHLLYFIVKNHSFVDGNKRIAAALFICFLQKNDLLYRKNREQAIDNNALVALTIMIASSKPVDKEMMIKVILNLLG